MSEMGPQDTIVVMVTCSSSDEADRIAHALLEERLVACVNIAGRIRSLFHWEGVIARESESLLLMKTRAGLFESLCGRVREIHSYEVPEIIGMPITLGYPAYLDWIRESTAHDSEQ